MGLFFLFILILAVIELVKEACQKPTPKGTRFDWDAYYEDVRNGIGAMEQVRKCERGGYYTTKPLPEKSTTTESKK